MTISEAIASLETEFPTPRAVAVIVVAWKTGRLVELPPPTGPCYSDEGREYENHEWQVMCPSCLLEPFDVEEAVP